MPIQSDRPTVQAFCKSRFASLAALAFLALGPISAPLHPAAYACAFDFTKPERTAIDFILDADALVLVRPHTGNEFSYQVTSVLRGEQGTYELPHLVDSATRRALKSNPADAILYARIDGTVWTRVTYVDADFQAVLETTLANADNWRVGYNPTRFATFEALQQSPSDSLRELAIRELDKAPYAMLKTLDLQIPTESLLADLWTPSGYSYQPIRVLLLGLSKDPAARTEIHGYFDRVQSWDWAENIGAFSAALIELDGVEGVRRLDDLLLSDPSQPADKLQGVIAALAVQRGVASDETRRAIDAALKGLLTNRPDTASYVAQQFSTYSDWSQRDPLEKLVRDKRLISMADLMTVSVYVAQARDAVLTTPPDKG